MSDGPQKVNVGEYLSDELKIKYDMPKGSVLGPCYFWYTTITLQLASKTITLLFLSLADDTYVLIIHKDLNQIEWY